MQLGMDDLPPTPIPIGPPLEGQSKQCSRFFMPCWSSRRLESSPSLSAATCHDQALLYSWGNAFTAKRSPHGETRGDRVPQPGE